MNFLSGLGLVLFCSVGYSTGATFLQGNKQYVPRIFDIIIVTTVCIVALLSREFIGKWIALLIWFFISGILGYLLRLISPSISQIDPKKPAVVHPEKNNLKRMKKWWTDVSQQIGNYQSRLLLMFIYFIIVVPYGVILLLTGDPLRLKTAKSSTWLDWKDDVPNIDNVRRQF